MLHAASACLFGCLLISGRCEAADEGPASTQTFIFDIAAGPLAETLAKFAASAGLQIFYETDLVSGREAPAIRGTLSAGAALELLLDGSGLVAKSFERGTVTLLSQPPVAEELLAGPKSEVTKFLPYLALVQHALRSALCGMQATRMDAAEVRARLWIGPTGAISDAEVLSLGARGWQYRSALRAMRIATPPPPGMPQPITLLVLPRRSAELAECATAGARLPVKGSPQ